MPKDDRVLIDTSVWIDYFAQRGTELVKTVDLLLRQDQVATAAIIMAELNQGVKSSAEGKTLKTYFKPLHWIPGTDAHWEQAGALSWALRHAGRTVNLTDCYIASIASSAGARIYSLDKHFQWIAGQGGCQLFTSPYSRSGPGGVG